MPSSLFDRLEPQPPDSLLTLIGECRADPRPDKIDLGVGVYRDIDGATPILGVVKKAERRLLDQQTSKGYLGPEGNLGFAAALKALVLGADGEGRIACVQTPGGTGALRLAMDLLAKTKSGGCVWVGTPTWPNHLALLAAAGLEVRTYRHFDRQSQAICFDEILASLAGANPGDVALFHGCCHNPSGADFSLQQWQAVAELLAERHVLPLIDLAYQGLGESFAADGRGAHVVLDRCGEALLAYSCDKNFALYRERVGALFACTRDCETAGTVLSNLLGCARSNWSMPPDHGAAVVQEILDDAALTNAWRDELQAMQSRIAGMRRALAAAHPDFAPLGSQRGMFSLLPVDAKGVAWLKREHGVYMPGSGRINVAGLTGQNLPRFVEAWIDLGKHRRG
jgi:aromatic-amino-acid transaminase